MNDFNSNMVNKTIKEELRRVIVPLNTFLSLNESTKNFSECNLSEKYLIRIILKEELGIISTKTYHQATVLLNQSKIFTEYLEEYLYNVDIHTKKELVDLVGSFRTLIDTFSMCENIPFVNKQYELFNSK